MLRSSPDAEVPEEFRKGSRLIVSIEPAGIRQDPSVTAPEAVLLEAHPGIFDARDNPIGADAHEGGHGGPPAFDFGFKAPAARAKFLAGEFIGARGGPVNQICDSEIQIEKEGTLKGREEPRGESAVVECGPKAVARPAEVMADGGGVKTWIDADEKHDEVFRNEIPDTLVTRSEDLSFGRFPGDWQFPIHSAI